MASAIGIGLLGALVGAPCSAPGRFLPQPVRGVVLSLHDADSGRSYRPAVREIAALGANAVSIMPIWEMADVRAPRVEQGTTTRGQVEEALGAAREAGLAILVAPTLHISRLGEGEWRGVLAPPSWEAWFGSYEERLLDLARLAEEHDVEALLIGSELCSSEGFSGRWRELIARVRGVFRGSLAYQANWDHRQAPTFLDELDVAASNAYFELVHDAERPSIARLVAAWEPHRADLVGWARGLGKPLLVTEVGYPSVQGAVAYPWDYTREGEVDLEVQRRAYEAFLRSFEAAPGLLGYFVYEWWGEGGPQDRGYTPRGKPAAAALERWFRRAGR